MKMIIHGKKYDTETAIKRAEYFNHLSREDFRWLRETLFQKVTGEFFLFGQGGAMTQYSVSYGDRNYCGGEKIIPMSGKDAVAWVERYANDKYEDIFGEVDE